MVKYSMEGRWGTFSCQFICLLVLIISSDLQDCYGEGIDLLKFRQKVYNDPFNSLASWNTDEGSDPCNWSGVHCIDGKVQMLDLSGLSLAGTLAPELGNLEDLQVLILCRNYFTGAIPRELGRLKRLKFLDFRENSLTGEIPREIGLMVSLTSLLLCGNIFQGTIPREILELKLLSELQFDADLEPGNGRKIGCTKRNFENRCTASISTSYRPEIAQSDDQKLQSRRRLLDHFSPGNLEALPALTVSPSKVIFLPISMSSGSFLALSNLNIPSHSPPPPITAPTSPKPQPQGPQSTSKIWIYVCVALAAALLIATVVVLFFLYRRRGRKSIKPWKSGLSRQLQKAFVTGVPKLNKSELEVACEDFSNIIETLDGCTVYKGTLSSGVEIAVACSVVTSADDWPKAYELAYRKKIEVLSRVNHKNFVNLLGHCEEEVPFARMIVYEFGPNGTLFEHLYVKELEPLDWSVRMRIIMGVAYCLEYMHELNPPVVHSGLNSKAVYLTDDYTSKIAERVFARMLKNKDDAKQEGSSKRGSSVSSLYREGSSKRPCPYSNIYQFGVLMLEIVTGKPTEPEEHGSLLDWAGDRLNDKQAISSLVDPALQSSFKSEELEGICEMIQACVRPNRKQRPVIKDVANRLREVTGITPEAAVPRQSPLWWAELEILSLGRT